MRHFSGGRMWSVSMDLVSNFPAKVIGSIRAETAISRCLHSSRCSGKLPASPRRTRPHSNSVSELARSSSSSEDEGHVNLALELKRGIVKPLGQ